MDLSAPRLLLALGSVFEPDFFTFMGLVIVLVLDGVATQLRCQELAATEQERLGAPACTNVISILKREIDWL